MILATLAFSSYQNMQTTTRLNEYTNNLEQSIRKVQRDAMLLERRPDENWIYGLGISFDRVKGEEKPPYETSSESEISSGSEETLDSKEFSESKPPVETKPPVEIKPPVDPIVVEPGNGVKYTGNYTVFKWCSKFPDYGDIRTSSDLPNFNPAESLSLTNGNLPVQKPISSVGYCNNTTEDVLVKYSLFGDRSAGTGIDITLPESTVTIEPVVTNFEPMYKPEFLNSMLQEGDVQYIVFEAVTGRAFFYDSFGRLLNYSLGSKTERPQPLREARPFVMRIVPFKGSKGKKITISHISGRVLVEPNE